MSEIDIMKAIEDLAAETEKKPLIPEIERKHYQGIWLNSPSFGQIAQTARSATAKRRPTVSRSLDARLRRIEAAVDEVQKMVADIHQVLERDETAQHPRAVCDVVVTVTVDITKEGDLYLSQAREIDVSSFGESEEEALDMIREACELYLEPPSGEMPEFRVAKVEVVLGG